MYKNEPSKHHHYDNISFQNTSKHTYISSGKLKASINMYFNRQLVS